MRYMEASNLQEVSLRFEASENSFEDGMQQRTQLAAKAEYREKIRRISLGKSTMTLMPEPYEDLRTDPINRATRFENKVESLDLVAGESLIKDRAAARFNALVGSMNVVAGELLLLLPLILGI